MWWRWGIGRVWAAGFLSELEAEKKLAKDHQSTPGDKSGVGNFLRGQG